LPDKKVKYAIPSSFPWGVALVSLRGGAFSFANDYMQRYYFDGDCAGLTIDECFNFPRGRKLEDLKHALDSGQAWTGRVVPNGNKHGISSVELMLQCDTDDPSQVWLYTMEHPAVEGLLRFSSRSEIKILQALLDNTLEYVFLRDLNGDFIIINKAFRDAVDIASGESPVGKKIDNFVSPESAKWIRGIDQQVYNSGQPSVNQVALFVLNNGTEHWVQLTTVPVLGSQGHMVGSVSVARDISDLKRTESELRHAIVDANAASRAKGEFLAAMSHEIRTPINGIIGASELCQETQLDLEQRDYLATVIQCSDTLLSLVNDVLDFSKIEAGQLELEKMIFSPMSLLEDVAGVFLQLVRKQGLELILNYGERLPHYVVGDRVRVKQILYNLIGNAIKFTERGAIVVNADLLDSKPQQARIAFSVKDSGIGISEPRTKAIFKSFTQADMSTTRKYGGTGLGLSICQELVELMTGVIRVESEPGQGSIFTFEVPFELQPHDGADVSPYNFELAGLRVLIVEDNETSRNEYQQLCRNWGYSCATAKDAQEALTLLEESLLCHEPFQLLLLDQQMPSLSGLDFAGLLSNRADLKSVRVILLSSSLDRAEVERAEALGLVRALPKPIKRSTLLEVILETFKLGALASVEAKLPTEVELASAIKFEGLDVLLAEDNAINQNIAVRRLQRLGHTVTVASNGLEVLRLVKTQAFDCILMDMQMPEMDGYAATASVRALEGQSKQRGIYIIAMTAHAMKGDRERCLDAGMDNYISKPFRVDRLKEVLADAGKYKGNVISISAPPSVSRVQPTRQLSSFLTHVASLESEDQQDLYEVSALLADAVGAEFQKFDQAISVADFSVISGVAHTLTGVVGIFHGEDFLQLVQQIEVACARSDLATVEGLRAQLQAVWLVLLEDVQAWAQAFSADSTSD